MQKEIYKRQKAKAKQISLLKTETRRFLTFIWLMSCVLSEAVLFFVCGYCIIKILLPRLNTRCYSPLFITASPPFLL